MALKYKAKNISLSRNEKIAIVIGIILLLAINFFIFKDIFNFQDQYDFVDYLTGVASILILFVLVDLLIKSKNEA